VRESEVRKRKEETEREKKREREREKKSVEEGEWGRRKGNVHRSAGGGG
jgi:hypothetical protein